MVELPGRGRFAFGESDDRLEACRTGRLALVWTLLLSTPSLLAQTTNPDEIPPFRPPKGELPPTFWDEHALPVILISLALLALAVVVWRIIANRPPPAPPTTAETARAALIAIVGASANAGTAANSIETSDRVSTILRTYFVAALGLPVPQLTNRELAGELHAQSKLTPALRQSAAAFLLALDQFRFNPDLNAPVPSAAQTAMNLVDQTEAELRPPESPATAAPTT